VPIDPSTEPATATSRRTFLSRTAVGGALVTAGAVATPLSGLLTGASAQEGGDDLLTDGAFASFATPLELSAVQAYSQALSGDLLDADWVVWARQFQRNHQSVADLLATLVAEGEPAPRADVDLSSRAAEAISAAGDQDAILAALAVVEETLTATHLSALPVLREQATAGTVARVLAVEGQQAALLTVASGASIESVTPAQASTDGALSPGDAGAAAEATTTTAAN